jgi:hypothetical protein
MNSSPSVSVGGILRNWWTVTSFLFVGVFHRWWSYGQCDICGRCIDWKLDWLLRDSRLRGRAQPRRWWMNGCCRAVKNEWHSKKKTIGQNRARDARTFSHQQQQPTFNAHIAEWGISLEVLTSSPLLVTCHQPARQPLIKQNKRPPKKEKGSREITQQVAE